MKISREAENLQKKFKEKTNHLKNVVNSIFHIVHCLHFVLQYLLLDLHVAEILVTTQLYN